MKFTISGPMLLLIFLILTGCTGQTTSKDSNKQQTQLDPLPPEEVFQQNCASCHGGNLEGFVGPNLQKVGSKYSQDKIIKIIQSGKGKMPAQSQLPSEVQQKLAIWLSQKKKKGGI